MERPAYRKLRGERYRNPSSEWLAKFIQEQLFTLDYGETAAWYAEMARKLSPLNGELALLGCNDRYFLLTVLLGRQDAEHSWLFDRCREVERDPDGYIDLWARFHYKSTIITFAGAIQEVMCDPEITIAIFSVIKPIAEAFLNQIKEEFEQNEKLKQVYPDVLYALPRQNGSDGRPAKWGVARGIMVKRKSNPKEATIEAHGLIDGQPTSRHFRLHIYDDVVTQDYLSDDQIRKTTERWELADNLGSHLGVRKWMPGTRYHFADTYGVVIDRKSLKPRIYPATDDGTLTGKPVFLSQRALGPAQERPAVDRERAAPAQSDRRQRGHVLVAVATAIRGDPGGDERLRPGRSLEGRHQALGPHRHRRRRGRPGRQQVSARRRAPPHEAHRAVGLHQAVQAQMGDTPGRADGQGRIRALRPAGRPRGHQGHDDTGEQQVRRSSNSSTPRKGRHAKPDRIERLEPDIREGRFYLPCVAYNGDFGPPGKHICYWSVWTEETSAKRASGRQGEIPRAQAYNIGQITFTPDARPDRRNSVAR